MKNAFTAKVKILQKFLPTWSGSDVGHTAGRDWYAALLLTILLGGGLLVVDMNTFRETHTVISEEPSTLPVRGLPVTEEKILEVWKQFELRNSEFESYSREEPRAPALESASQQIVPPVTEEDVLETNESE